MGTIAMTVPQVVMLCIDALLVVVAIFSIVGCQIPIAVVVGPGAGMSMKHTRTLDRCC